jgi:hypothetical protein
MTETEWLVCEDTKPMLEFLRDRASSRKLCLFAACCCRHIWPHLVRRSRKGVEVAERYFEGRAREAALNAAIAEATTAFEEFPDNTIEHYVSFAASLVPVNDVEEADAVAYTVAKVIGYFAAYPDESIEPTDETEALYAARLQLEQTRQCRVLQCIVGNPFRPVHLPPEHRTSPIVALARAASDERQLPSGELDPQRLAVLADALEETGAPGEMVAHLRSPGPHVRGCFVIDLCLGLS